MAVAIAGVGAIGAAVVSAPNDAAEPSAVAQVRATTTTTAAPAQVLGVVVDNTTTTVGVAAATTTAAPATTTTPSTVAATAPGGRIWGYSFATTGDNDKTTITLRRGDTVVAERRTDSDGLFEFRDLPAGSYTLQRTSESRSCATTTTAGEEPPCTRASSRADGPDVNLESGQDYRVDVF